MPRHTPNIREAGFNALLRQARDGSQAQEQQSPKDVWVRHPQPAAERTSTAQPANRQAAGTAPKVRVGCRTYQLMLRALLLWSQSPA
jgi:hypothetical protein